MNKEEPSVLDYILAKLMPWRGPAPVIPPAEKPIQKPDAGASISRPDNRVETAAPEPDWIPPVAPSESIIEEGRPAAVTTAPRGPAAALRPPETAPLTAVETVKLTERVVVWPWRALLALILALLAQASLEPSAAREWLPGVVIYLLAAAALIWANLRNEWMAAPLPESEIRRDPLTVRWLPLLLGMALAVGAFLELKDNLFTGLNLTLWALAVALTLIAFWLGSPRTKPSLLRRFLAFLRRPKWNVEITAWTLLVAVVIGVSLFFRVYHISQVPPEMVSDHAEKLLDVSDVLDGQWHIFFPRNTGREAIQFYLTAFIIRYLGTGVSFLSLKIGTVLAGLLTLPFIYMLGKEMGSRRAGLLAALFAGIGYWPNVISRMGLRFPLYPLFVAPALYFLLRGLRTSNRNDFILSGVALGIGLHGYTPIRILPVVIVIVVGLYLLHRQTQEARRQALVGLVLITIVSALVFLPLLRYAQENPDTFGYRAFTRLGTVERPLPGPAGQIFLQNTWKAVTMFGWDDGEIWPVSVTHRPALDVVSAALFYLGVGLLLLRYLRRRHWLDLFLVLSVPLLMMPSILSLAFPSENPALNRAAGALVPVFLIVGLSLDGLMTAIQSGLGRAWGNRLAWSLALVLGVYACRQNYDLVFNQYQSIYAASSWNTSEMGAVIRDFAASVGSPDTAYVAAFPYWVDTRLVGINAGYPRTDYAIWPDHFQDTKADPRAKLFLVKPEDTAGLDALRQLYPQGVSTTYVSKVQDHDFIIFFVPPGP